MPSSRLLPQCRRVTCQSHRSRLCMRTFYVIASSHIDVFYAISKHVYHKFAGSRFRGAPQRLTVVVVGDGIICMAHDTHQSFSLTARLHTCHLRKRSSWYHLGMIPCLTAKDSNQGTPNKQTPATPVRPTVIQDRYLRALRRGYRPALA